METLVWSALVLLTQFVSSGCRCSLCKQASCCAASTGVNVPDACASVCLCKVGFALSHDCFITWQCLPICPEIHVACVTCACSVLDKIKCNLRKEQRTVMEMNFITMHRILSPLQVRFALHQSVGQLHQACPSFCQLLHIPCLMLTCALFLPH